MPRPNKVTVEYVGKDAEEMIAETGWYNVAMALITLVAFGALFYITR